MVKKHIWKVFALLVIFGFAGAMSYDDELEHEIHAPAYFNALNAHYERDYSPLYAELRAQDAADEYAKEVLLGYAHTEGKSVPANGPTKVVKKNTPPKSWPRKCKCLVVVKVAAPQIAVAAPHITTTKLRKNSSGRSKTLIRPRRTAAA